MTSLTQGQKNAQFVSELGHLKHIKREGYRLAGVSQPESIAEHSLRAAQIGFILAKLEGFPEPHKVATALIFHDIGEIRVGDINKVANRYITVDEERAVNEQCASLDEGCRSEIQTLWVEVERGKDELGKIARDADRLEMAFSARELEAVGHKTMAEWVTSAGSRLETQSGKLLFEAMLTIEPYTWWDGLKKL